MKRFYSIAIFTLLATFLYPSPFTLHPIAHAQTAPLTDAQRAELQQELAQVEADQKQAAADLVSAQSKSASLSRDITVLDAKIKTAQLNIKAKNLLILTLGNDINIKQGHIDNLEEHIAKGKQTLADVLRRTNELDSYSLPEVVLAQTSLTGFFEDVDSFQAVQQGLSSTFNQLRADEASTSQEKSDLESKQNAAEDARQAIQTEQKNIQADQAQQKQLLTISKGNEKSYASLVAQKKAEAAKIRAALFALRDAAAIPFGQALQYATLASQKTGVRPAFLLAVITQESALGGNVGQCYVTNSQTGDGISAKSGNAISHVMNPSRDIPVFTQIMQALGGSDITKQVVSCPQDVGWGGAMGPAQFIPSTWQLFANRIASALNISGPTDPWNPAHAFMASALYLGDLGAGSGTYSSERNAACKYYSGRTCAAGRGNIGYGDSVVAKADNIQRNMIDPLMGL